MTSFDEVFESDEQKDGDFIMTKALEEYLNNLAIVDIDNSNRLYQLLASDKVFYLDMGERMAELSHLCFSCLNLIPGYLVYVHDFLARPMASNPYICEMYEYYLTTLPEDIINNYDLHPEQVNHAFSELTRVIRLRLAPDYT